MCNKVISKSFKYKRSNCCNRRRRGGSVHGGNLRLLDPPSRRPLGTNCFIFCLLRNYYQSLGPLSNNYLSNSCSIDLITFSLLLSSLIMTDEWAVNPVCSVACDDN